MRKLWAQKYQYPFRNNGSTQNGQNTQNTQNAQNTNNPTNVYQNANSKEHSKANNTNNYVPPRTPRFQGKCDHSRK